MGHISLLLVKFDTTDFIAATSGGLYGGTALDLRCVLPVRNFPFGIAPVLSSSEIIFASRWAEQKQRKQKPTRSLNQDDFF